MVYTNTIMVNPSKSDKNIKSISKDGLSYFLPLDLQERLDEEVQEIYTINGEENILNINITPITAEFKFCNDVIMQLVVRYIITYIYKG